MMKIDELIKNCMKEQKFAELKVYRNLKSLITNFKTQKNAPEYTEAAEISIIKKYINNSEEALKEYLEAGREALVAECKFELEVLKKFLPEPVKESDIYYELDKYCKSENLLSENGQNLIPKKEMVNAIKYLKNIFPTADGKLISNIVKEYVL